MYLAFYQSNDKSNSSNKFNNDFGIEYYAKLKIIMSMKEEVVKNLSVIIVKKMTFI